LNDRYLIVYSYMLFSYILSLAKVGLLLFYVYLSKVCQSLFSLISFAMNSSVNKLNELFKTANKHTEAILVYH